MVRWASKLISKCTQMNYEMNCITMHSCTEIYCNELQKARVHWRVPVLFVYSYSRDTMATVQPYVCCISFARERPITSRLHILLEVNTKLATWYIVISCDTRVYLTSQIIIVQIWRASRNGQGRSDKRQSTARDETSSKFNSALEFRSHRWQILYPEQTNIWQIRIRTLRSNFDWSSLFVRPTGCLSASCQVNLGASRKLNVNC